jgi:hypothetical protein
MKLCAQFGRQVSERTTHLALSLNVLRIPESGTAEPHSKDF